MLQRDQIYLSYWKQLKAFVDDQGLHWRFYSFEPVSEITVKVGSPHQKICLSLIGRDNKTPRKSIAASLWIQDSREDFEMLKSKRVSIEAEMGRPLVWDSRPGRKSCWVRCVVPMDLSREKDWPVSFQWFAEYAQKLRDVCHGYLQ